MHTDFPHPKKRVNINEPTLLTHESDNDVHAGALNDALLHEKERLNVVLVEPEIPQNTGNIARTCACTDSVLHLVEPLGFRLTQKNLMRSGCDYWDKVDIRRWACIEEFLEAHNEDELYFFTGQSTRNYADVTFKPGSYLLYGRESAGIDPVILNQYVSRSVRIPMYDDLRSLNLSNAVAISLYEAYRQLGFAGLM